MRGADKIIQLRMQGRKPAVINLWDYPISWELEPTEVVIHKLSTASLDLRFVLDCLVTIHSESRADELKEMCIANGARQVVAGPWKQGY